MKKLLVITTTKVLNIINRIAAIFIITLTVFNFEKNVFSRGKEMLIIY